MILIDYDRCDSCGECVRNCPKGVFEFMEGTVVVANPNECMICCYCVEICPRSAVRVEGC